MKNKHVVLGPKLVLGYLGLFMILIGILELIPALNAFIYTDELHDAHFYIYAGFAGEILGFCLFSLILKKEKGQLTHNQGLTLLLSVWLTAIFFFAIPWWASGKMSFTRAFFECTSGFTTTGMTTCDIANTSHVFLFSRSLMTFLGGIGLVLILTTAVSDKSRTGIYTLEGHNEKLLPNLAKSARLMFSIYLTLTLICTFAFRIAGLNWFDSLTTSMSAISTGGFSTNPQSIAGYNNIGVEVIVSIESAIGATNFLFFVFIMKGQFKKAFSNFEFLTTVLIFGIFGTLMVLGFSLQEGSFGLGCRYGIFHFVSSMTGAGFTNLKFPLMSISSPLMILTLMTMAIGGESGSTAGGIKHHRIAYIFIALKESIYRKCISKDYISTTKVIKYGDPSIVNGDFKKEAVNYAFSYILFATIGGLIISCCKNPTTGSNYGPLESFFECLSCLGTTGLSSGITNANTPALALWVETISMFFGRLEITILFVYIQYNILHIKDIGFRNRRARIEE